jgi:hypothetical protein
VQCPIWLIIIIIIIIIITLPIKRNIEGPLVVCTTRAEEEGKKKKEMP